MPDWLFILIVIISANLPWLSERFLMVFSCEPKGKKVWMRFLEWLILYFVVGGIALLLESRRMGNIQEQDWEFYAITVCLYLIFALPGFIYRHDLRHLLERR